MRRRRIYRRRFSSKATRMVKARRNRARNGMQLPKARKMYGFPGRALITFKHYRGPFIHKTGAQPTSDHFAATGSPVTNYHSKMAFIYMNDIDNPWIDSTVNKADPNHGYWSTALAQDAVGAQPKWYDEYKALYGKYRVYEFLITVVCRYDCAPGDTQTQPFMMYLDPHNNAECQTSDPEDTRTFTSWKQIKEWGCPHVICKPGRVTKLSRKFKIHAVEKQNKLLWKSQTGWDANTDASPSFKTGVLIGLITKTAAVPETNDLISFEVYTSYKTMMFNQDRHLRQDAVN